MSAFERADTSDLDGSFRLDGAWSGSDGRQATDGVELVLSGGRIAAVEPIPAPGNRWFALPGFVNAHCHLDLTAIRGEELPRATFAGWLAGLLAARRGLEPAGVSTAIRAGTETLLRSGTVAVGDIDSMGLSLPIVRAGPLEGVVYRELLGPQAAALGAPLSEALAREAALPAAPRVALGISPHAPYSAGEGTYAQAAEWSRRFGCPVASHVAETAEEEELLRHDRGPLADYLRELRFPAASWPDRHVRPFDRIARAVGAAVPLAVIHGNYLTAYEIAACAARNWPVVYCPRSHGYFGHTRHPAAALLAAGATLALGTDSRASNAGLDLWREMEHFRRHDREIPDAAILAAATRGGRSALRLEPAELRRGDVATFQLVRPTGGDRGPGGAIAAAAVRGDLETHAVVIRGALVHGDRATLPFHPVPSPQRPPV